MTNIEGFASEGSLTDPEQYSLIFINDSGNDGSVCIYQQDPDIGVENVSTLAWLVKYAYPTTIVSFNWISNYNFVWVETNSLAQGATISSGQVWNANLSIKNKVTLTYQKAYTFESLETGPSQGSLYINTDKTIPLNQASVGIGMSRSATFVVQTEPNLGLKFTPHPSYWIAFGNYTQGQTLNIKEIANSAQIYFPYGIYSMTAILSESNTWEIKPSFE